MPMPAVALRFHDLSPRPGDILAEAVAGLRAAPKRLEPKWFYDRAGCALFARICASPEYYPTRTETATLRAHARDIAALMGEDACLIELGGSDPAKARILLDHAGGGAYLPVDIAPEPLLRAAEEVAAAYPGLEVVPVCADYTRLARLPARPAARGRKVLFFPGSTVGNLHPGEAVLLLGGLRRWLAPEAPGRPPGALLVGVDLKKDAAILEAAYNDAGGATARFNLNLLARLNRELGADFRLEAFRHQARYDRALGRVEMHLVSRVEQVARLGHHRIGFRAGESIHTENAYKYHPYEFMDLASRAGYETSRVWMDPRRWFGVFWCEAP